MYHAPHESKPLSRAPDPRGVRAGPNQAPESQFPEDVATDLGAGRPGGCLELNSQEGSRGKGQNDRRKREALLPPQGPFCEITGRTATRRCEE